MEAKMKFSKSLLMILALGISSRALANVQIVCEDNSKSWGFHDHSQDMFYNEGVDAVIDRLNKTLAELPSNAQTSTLTIAGGEPFKFSKVCVLVSKQ
jgi:hypothetical protein